jgi:hypothetical protein
VGADEGLEQQPLRRPVGEAGAVGLLVRWCSAADDRRAIAAAAWSGTSESTASRARTSSLRFVSWVEEATIADGQRAWASAQCRWKSSGDVPNTLGSPPTSLSDSRRVPR